MSLDLRPAAPSGALRSHWQAWHANGYLTVLLWPCISLLAIVLLWAAVYAHNRADQVMAEHAALRDVASQAHAYEQFLTRSISQMDHISMALKYDWEQSKGNFKFSDQTRQGMFTDTAFIAVTIYGSDGKRRTSTREGRAPASLAGESTFEFHKNNISTSLRITFAARSADNHKTLMFSRRLDGADDSFDGVVVLQVDGDYFTSFYNAKSLGEDGIVGMLEEEGEGRVEQAGVDQPGAAPKTLLRQPASTFAGPDDARLIPANAFADGTARFVAWQHARIYPFISVVALSQAEEMASTDSARRDRENNAALASISLVVLALVAAFLSRRLMQRKDEEEAVRAAYRIATDSATDGFYMVNPIRDESRVVVDFDIVDCNERGASFYSLTRSELLGARLSSLPFGRDSEALARTCRVALAAGQVEEDVEMPRDSRIQVEWIRRTLVRAGGGLAMTVHDISRQKAHERELVRLATEDTLTALPNRYWLLNHLPAAIEAARLVEGSLGLLFIDLDGFKHVNDTQGHAVGDALLKVAASRLRSLLRPSDSVVRFGGDEFIVVLDPLESDIKAAAIAQRVLDAFGVPFDIGDETQLVGASVGISVYPRDGEDAMTLIKHGDIAMYSGKSEGKGQYRFYQPSLYERLKSRAQSKQELLEALERDQLVLYYQPRVDALTGELRSMEALVRWMHPQRGIIPPLEFIPLAETSGLITQVGEAVMQKACRQIAEWKAAGLPVVPVSINVSPMQFSQGKVHRQLAMCLATNRIPSSLLEVEITESAMMGDQMEIMAELSAIRSLGVKLHIDDFGTGYSSLSQLQKLRMDVLKVDRAFTVELGNSKDGKVFFQAIVSMAHALGMTVVAEGVETPEQLAILQALSCNEVQGYLVSRPVPAAEMVDLMHRRFLFEGEATPA